MGDDHAVDLAGEGCCWRERPTTPRWGAGRLALVGRGAELVGWGLRGPVVLLSGFDDRGGQGAGEDRFLRQGQAEPLFQDLHGAPLVGFQCGD